MAYLGASNARTDAAERAMCSLPSRQRFAGRVSADNEVRCVASRVSPKHTCVTRRKLQLSVSEVDDVPAVSTIKGLRNVQRLIPRSRGNRGMGTMKVCLHICYEGDRIA